MNQPKCIPTLTQKDIDRFWSKVEIKEEGECWPWKFSTNRLGYGKFQIGARTQVRAHRVAFAIIKGNPGTLMVLHACDNPPCCNPNHLFKGGSDDNMTDKTMKGRASKGEQCRKKCTADEAIAIRALYAAGSLSMAYIGSLFNVTAANVCAIVNRQTWKHI